MARRRSLNRRWSRKSLNTTELDQNSEVFEIDDPLWWKKIEGDVTMRPSMAASRAETTASILSTSSRVDPSELRDAWWDNLERTKLSSSRRFSARHSVDQSETVQESFVSEGDDDVSIKKRKVVLKPRTNQSRGHENFLKVLDESDAAAQSEPVPGKRKSKSPARSDTELLRKKALNRRSRTAEKSQDNVDDASFTSNDTDKDVIVKPRPKLMKKRFVGKQPDDSARNDEPGPSGTNITDNGNSAAETPRAIDLNEAGLMGPPKSASHRKRLSTISRKLNLTSDDSENEAAPKKAKFEFAKKARERASINPFDEILSGHLDEDNSQSEIPANKSAAATKTADNISQSRDDDLQIGVSSIANNDDNDDRTSRLETVPMGDSVARTQGYSTIGLDTTSVEHTQTRASISVTKEIPRFSKKRANSMRQSALTQENIPAVDPRTRVMQDWQSTDSEVDSLVEEPSKSMNVSKENPMKTIHVDTVSRVSVGTTLHSQRLDESDKKSDDEERADEKINRSTRSTRSSRIIAESAYELPDKERNDSPIISLSESENEKSTRVEREKKVTRESANRSIDRVEAKNTSRQSSARMNASPRKIDSDESISEGEALSSEMAARKSTKRDSHPTDRARISRKSANVSRQQTVLDEIISEGDAEEDTENRAHSTSLTAKKKLSTAKKSASYVNKSRALYVSEESSDEVPKESEKTTSNSTKRSLNAEKNSSRQLVDSDESISEGKLHDARKSNSKSTKANSSRQLIDSDESISEGKLHDARKSNSKSTKANSYRQRIESDESISEEELYDGDESRSKSTRRNYRTEGSNSNAARNSSAPADVPGQDIESDDARDTAKSESTYLSAKRKASSARNSSAHVPHQIRMSENSDDEDEPGEEKTNATSVALPPERKMSTARKSIARPSVSTLRIESDESSDEEDPKERNSKYRNSSAKGKMLTSRTSTVRQNAPGQNTQTENEIAAVADIRNRKSAIPVPKKKVNTARKSIAHKNISVQRIDSDESSDDDDPKKGNSKNLNLSAKGKMSTGQRNTARGNVSEQSENEREDETSTKLTDRPPKRNMSTARKSIVQRNVSAQPVESESDEEVETAKDVISVTAKGAKKDPPTRSSKNTSTAVNTTNLNKTTLSTAETSAEEISPTIPSDAIPLDAELTKLPSNRNNNDGASVLRKSNVSRTQKPITDFLQSKFLQKTDRSGKLNVTTSFDDAKFNLVIEKMEKIKQRQIEAMNMQAAATRKESRRPDNAPKAKNSRSKENVPKATAKPAKVVDKAFIVNGTVYKRPKLPRPKPWVTDRLYRHLWKKMEPKFDLATRVKSEKFVVQLSEVVAVTLRRKKYESYKLEIDALMKEMAKLGIIKTRNDFYDFCYDFLPYDFRLKATPIMLPGNVRNIPYDPKTLHIPILADDSRSG